MDWWHQWMDWRRSESCSWDSETKKEGAYSPTEDDHRWMNEWITTRVPAARGYCSILVGWGGGVFMSHKCVGRWHMSMEHPDETQGFPAEHHAAALSLPSSAVGSDQRGFLYISVPQCCSCVHQEEDPTRSAKRLWHQLWSTHEFSVNKLLLRTRVCNKTTASSVNNTFCPVLETLFWI